MRLVNDQKGGDTREVFYTDDGGVAWGKVALGVGFLAVGYVLGDYLYAVKTGDAFMMRKVDEMDKSKANGSNASNGNTDNAQQAA